LPKTRPLFLCCLLLVISFCVRGETDLEAAARLIKAKSFPEAQRILERSVKADPRNPEALYWMGELQFATQNYPKALDCADQAIRLNSLNANYQVLRGNTLGRLAQQANLFRARGLAADGLAALEKAVQLEPGNRSAVYALFNWYFNVSFLGGGSQDKAKALAEQTVRRDPSRGHYLNGLILKKQKKPDAAMAEYRLALAADPLFTADLVELGYLELEAKQVDPALVHFRKLVEVDPGNANSFDCLGDGLMAKGNLDEAVTAYRQALSLDPLFFSSMRSLGKVLEQAGRRDEAIEHYRHCVQLGTQKNIPQLISESKERLKALGVNE
jgi:tetratricopeptide (TPR) repeat protein